MLLEEIIDKLVRFRRIDDTIKKLKIQQDDKLEKWQVGLEDVNGWVARTSVKVESYTRLATDVDAALEQMDAFQVCCLFFFFILHYFLHKALLVLVKIILAYKLFQEFLARSANN